jgi:capsule polysaccharide export protein KpsE/RkpR
MAAKARADRLAAAEREVELSRRRLRETQENVVKPLQGYAAQNNFAGLIAASLAQGRRKGKA